MPDAVIELGELTDVVPGTVRGARPRRRAHRSSLRGLLVAVAVLAAATLTGSVHHDPPPRVVVIPAGTGDVAFPGRDDYVVVSDTVNAPGAPVQNKIVTVYALPAATRTSRTSVNVTGSINEVVTRGDLVLVGYQSDRAGNVATAAYSAGTEHQIWRRYGRLFGFTPSGRLAVMAEIPPGWRTPRWYGVDVRSGETVWRSDRPTAGRTPAPTVPAPVAGTPAPVDPAPGGGADEAAVTVLVTDSDERPVKLAVVSPDGRIELRDLDTGLATVAVTVPAPAVWRTAGPQIGVAGNLLLVSAAGRGTTAYSLVDLAERWRNPLDLAGRWVQPGCGDVVCLFDYAGGLQVLDADTGRERWSADGWLTAERLGPYLLVPPPDTDPAFESSRTVLDVATGRRRGTLDTWRLAGPNPAAGVVPVVREDARVPRAYFGMLDAGTLAIRVLGVAEQVAGGCSGVAGVLVCRRTDSSFGVWRFKVP